MGTKRLVQNTMVIVLAAAIVVMSVGYAMFSSQVSFAYPETMRKTNRNIHFENPTKLDTTNIADEFIAMPTLSNDFTSLTFAAKMTSDSIYEFTVDLRNAGSYDAVLESYKLTAYKNGEEILLDANSNLQYSVKWDDASSLEVGQELVKGGIRRLTVSVVLLNAETIEGEDYNFSLNLNYARK